jgi:hypothetical protein
VPWERRRKGRDLETTAGDSLYRRGAFCSVRHPWRPGCSMLIAGDTAIIENARETTMRTHYVEELESVRENLIQMGETTISLLAKAIGAVADPNSERSERASELESQTDHYHRLIHDQCLNLITLQSPVARDARFLTGVLEAIVDLELIADYPYEIVMLTVSMRRRPPSKISNHVSEVGARIRASLTTAMKAGARETAIGLRTATGRRNPMRSAGRYTRSSPNSSRRLVRVRSTWI